MRRSFNLPSTFRKVVALTCLLLAVSETFDRALAAVYTYVGKNSASGQINNSWNVDTNWAGGAGGFPNAAGDVVETPGRLKGEVCFYLNQDVTIGNLNWAGASLYIFPGTPRGKLIVDNGGVSAIWQVGTISWFWLESDMVLEDNLVLSISNSPGFFNTTEPMHIGGVLSGPGRLTLDASQTRDLNTCCIGPENGVSRSTYSGGTRLIGHPSGQVFFDPRKTGAFGTGDLELTCNGRVVLRNRFPTNDYIADTAALRLETAAVTNRAGVYLEGGVNEIVGHLYIDGVQQPAGTYGPTGSGTAEALDEFLTGAGILTVMSGAPDPGSVRNLPATDIAPPNVELHGEVVTANAAPTLVYAYWGQTDGGRQPEAWGNVVLVGEVQPGEFSVPIFGYNSGQAIYYRFFLTNALGGRWASSSAMLCPPLLRNELPAVGTNQATLRCSLLSTNGLPTRVTAFWGDNDGGTTMSNWQWATPLGVAAEGPLMANLDDLSAGTRYFYRFYGTNEAGAAWSGTSGSFKTMSPPAYGDITFFFGSDLHYGFKSRVPTSDERDRNVLNNMNLLPGQPYPASVGGDFVEAPRGVILLGDCTEYGATWQWAAFTNDWGLHGERLLHYPVFEGYGNHDGGPGGAVHEGIRSRNRVRQGLTNLSSNGYHYSWDWDFLHLVHLNVFPGNELASGVYGNTDPRRSLEFLEADLAANVGTSGRPVILCHHYGSDSAGGSLWWSGQQQTNYYETIKDYNVIAILAGHNHNLQIFKWRGIDCVTDATIGKFHGTFFAAHVTRTNLTLIERNETNGWGKLLTKEIRTPPVQAVSLVSTGACWRYHSLGEDLDTAWQQNGYDDSAWASAPSPLGYGEDFEESPIFSGTKPLRSPITTYFRHTFLAPLQAVPRRLVGRVLRDDGVVVYLNGTELCRDNLPAGVVTYATSALKPVEGQQELEFFSFSVPAESLQPGTNVLAVEVHQFRGNLAHALQPVAYWSFDEAVPPWADSVGTNRFMPVGTSVIAVSTGINGGVSNAHSFTDHLRAEASPELNFTGPFTVGGWFAYGKDTGLRATCVEKAGEFSLYYTGTAINRYRFGVNGDSVQDQSSGAVGAWRFVVGWYDGTNASIQVNNGPVYSVPATMPLATTNPLVALKTSGILASLAADEVFLFKRILTPEERTELYVAGSNPIPYDMSFDADLAGIWPSLPSILESPTNLVKFVGESVQLAAVVESPGPYSCQWCFNGVPLLDATNSVLLLDRVLQDQAGRYSLIASNVAGSVTSSPATLMVMELPQLRMGLQGNELGLIVAACPRPCTVLVSTNLTTWTELLTLPPMLNTTNVPIEWDSSTAASQYYRLRLGSEDSTR